MSILERNKQTTTNVRITSVRFDKDMLYVTLSDGREIGVSLQIKWLRWLAKATPQQRKRWVIDPWGDAIYWNDLDDGIELIHLLGMQSLTV